MPKDSHPSVIRWRLLISTLIFMAIVAYAKMHNLLPTVSLPLDPVSFQQSQTPPSTENIDPQAVIDYLNKRRQENDLPAVKENTTLSKTARLATLEVEDNNSLDTEINYGELLQAVSLKKPPKIESLAVFVTGFGNFKQAEGLEKSKLLSDGEFTQIGVATRQATIQDEPGIIIVITASPDFRETTTPVTTNPTTT